MLYSILRKILFSFDPEQSHYLSLKSLKIINQLGLSPLFAQDYAKPCEVFGLIFPNPVGLAAGLDKNADYVDALAALGFGFIEIGTVTPKPQEGNSKPRLFRLAKEEAIINRMGFNNKGVDYVAHRLEQTKYKGILGVNIGKNKDTPLEYAIDDYLIGMRKLWKFASYITINISSPNTPGLRDLQQGDALSHLLSRLKQEQFDIHTKHQKYVPLVVKIAPDMTAPELEHMADALLQNQIDGVIATNTTLSRNGVENSPFATETGGLSGKPLTLLSTQVVRRLHELLQDNIPIIASGGVMNAESAQEKFAAGAKLVQVYSGFIYRGPEIIRDIVMG